MQPTVTLRKLKDKLGRSLSLSTLHRRIRQVGYSRKRLSSKLLGVCTPDAIERFKSLHSSLSPHHTITSIDECHFSNRLFPQYGYSEIGKRCVLRNPRGGGWRSYSLILSISSDGQSFMRVIEGTVTRDKFRTWVKDADFPNGTVLLLDNCSIHHGNDSTFESLEVTPLYLPPYSPQYQPVELAFSKVKQIFRSLWPHPMGVPAAIEHAVSQITVSDIQGYFRHTERCISES